MNKLILRYTILTGFWLFTLIIIPTPSQATLIDAFDVFQGISSKDAAPVTVTDLDNGTSSGTGPYANIIGRRRDLSLTMTSNDAPNSHGSSLGTVSGSASWSTDSGVAGYASITWNGLSGAGLGGVDLKPSGENAFQFDFTQIDSTADVTLTVADNHGNSGSLRKTGLSNGTENYLFSDPNWTAAIDFSSVDSIKLDITDTAPSPDLTMSLFQTAVTIPLPEPSSMNLLGVGLIVFTGVGRKYRYKNNLSHTLSSGPEALGFGCPDHGQRGAGGFSGSSIPNGLFGRVQRC